MSEEPSGIPTIRWASDRSILVTVGDEPERQVPRLVRGLAKKLGSVRLSGVRAIIPAYTTVLVEIDPVLAGSGELETRLLEVLRDIGDTGGDPVDSVPPTEIPVCYEGADFAPDLEELGSIVGMSPIEVIERHSGRPYLVHFLGFMPGFPYLGGLDPALAAPRLATPRRIVPAGSVAIGGSQTGIYPFDSPGGWRIIGRTPLSMYDPRRVPRSLVSMGSRVRFVPVSRERFDRLVRKAAP